MTTITGEMMESTSDILKAAKRELQTRGWCQGTVQDGDGHVCAFGAISTALYGQPDDCISNAHFAPIDIMVRTVTGRDPREHGIGLAIWNDQTGRTAQEVIEAFDAAIAIAESQEALASPEALDAVSSDEPAGSTRA